MKRSAINQLIRDGDEFIRSHGFHLPPFAYFTPAQLKERKSELGAMIDARLGWDITDYGCDKFRELGLFLFTVRNGLADVGGRDAAKCYAEKIMISRRDQSSPMHRHITKTEDIINRGGARLALRMYESGVDGMLERSSKVRVMCDGLERVLAGGDILTLEPGESVTLAPGNWHEFWGEGGDVLVGEVSSVNDDENDNIFADPLGRFSEIEEDCEPLHLLVSDYAKWLSWKM